METNTDSPFTSKGYRLRKDWSSYNTYDMGRAFFSDGFVENTYAFHVFDNQNFFRKPALRDEALFYKKKEIPVTIYSVISEDDVLNTFKKLEIDYNEIAIFFFRQKDSIKAKVNLGDSLLKLSNFENESQMIKKSFDVTSDEIFQLSDNLSAKNVVSFFNKDHFLFEEDVENVSGLFNHKLKIEKKDITQSFKNEIYLTFDDGLEAGTEEVLKLLNEKNVKATFFIIGKKVESMYKRNKNLCFDLLNNIFENQCIGNHSYSHANDFYTEYYRKGGVTIKFQNDKEIKRSVEDDFIKSKNTILYYLGLAKGEKNPKLESYSDSELKSNSQKEILARFPGTNTWFINKDNIIDIKWTNRNLSGFDMIPARDTKEEARKIGKRYNIFGWDLEWGMDPKFRYNKIVRKAIEKKIKDKTISENIDDIDPYFDLYSKEFVKYDRCIEDVDTVKEKIIMMSEPKRVNVPDGTGMYSYDEISTKKARKIVLLMHDRQFRLGKINPRTRKFDPKDNSELLKLGVLIDELKKKNFIFKTLNEY